MKQGLQLNIGQSLTMTPQLQQAIKLLQLSTLDLQQEIQSVLDTNPLLEQDDDTRVEDVNKEQDPSQLDTNEALTKQEFSDDLPLEDSWTETYTSTPPSMANTNNNSFDGEMEDYQGSSNDSLIDHLLWQMELTPFTTRDQIIATTIIDSIDESGYLTTNTESILSSLEEELDELELDEINVVLKRIQHFEPLGVGARSTQECLQIQLRHKPESTPWRAEALMILELYMDLLGNRDYRTLARKTKLNESQLAKIMKLIQSLEPRPGNEIEQNHAQYIIPDVYVKKFNGKWHVSLNQDCNPNLSINQEYAQLCKGNISKTDSQYIKGHMQEAKWFIKSLENRNSTLLKVATCIVDKQQDFFELGDEAMKPMVLSLVADEVEMHESTISRVTTQKFMHTPKGIYELKFFFSSHVATDTGGECSSTAIRSLIKKLISCEMPNKPLSDNKITKLLDEKGIKIARRTIAKYREGLGIPPSNQRKQLL